MYQHGYQVYVCVYQYKYNIYNYALCIFMITGGNGDHAEACCFLVKPQAPKWRNAITVVGLYGPFSNLSFGFFDQLYILPIKTRTPFSAYHQPKKPISVGGFSMSCLGRGTETPYPIGILAHLRLTCVSEML